jgi:hypothetical protein
MRIIITEEEKSSIKRLYGLITEEDVPTPDFSNYTPEQWKAYYDPKKAELDALEKTQVKSRIDKKTTLPLRAGLTSIVNKKDKSGTYLGQLFRKTNLKLASDSNKMQEIATALEVAIKMCKEVIAAWEPNLDKAMVLTVTKEVQESGSDTVGGRVEFPIEWNPDSALQLYVNNLWDIGSGFIDSFNTQVIDKIKKFNTDLPNAKISLLSLDIKTSASRLRNKQGAGDLTFAQLSGYRNNTAKDYIINQLKANGVLNVDTVTPTQDYLAAKSDKNPQGNGDGSSGPNPPEPYAYINSGQVTMDSKPTEPRNKLGEPHKSIEEYEQYKFLKVTIKLEAKLDEPEKIASDFASFGYSLEAGGKKTEISIVKIKTKRQPPKWGLLQKIIDFFTPDPKKCAAFD